MDFEVVVFSITKEASEAHRTIIASAMSRFGDKRKRMKLVGTLRSKLLLTVLLGALLPLCCWSQSCDPPPSGLVGWWPASGNANDIWGTYSGTLNGGALANAAGEVGTAFKFDGTNGFISVPNSAALEPTNLTIEAWVKFDSLNSAGNSGAGHEYIAFKQNSRSGSFEGFDLGKQRVGTNDTFYFMVASSAGVEVEADATNRISTNVWYHVAGVRGSNYIQIYINGQLQGQATVNFTQDYGHLPLYFGTTGQSFWDGKLAGELDEVSLYNRALSASEIQAVYNAGSAGKCVPACVVPPSGIVGWWQGNGNAVDLVGNNNGVLTNGAAFGTGKVGQAFAFDGNVSSVILGNPPALQLQNLTIEAWVRRSGTNLGGVILGYDVGGYVLLIADDTGSPEFGQVGGSGVTANHPITDTNFHHVAVTKNGTTITFYVDGVAYPTGGLNVAFAFTTPAAIGDFGAGGGSFLGLVDELSVYNRALTAPEVLAIYAAGNTGKCVPGTYCQPPPSGLVSWWAGNGDANDSTGVANGSLQNNVSFTTGRVGQAFLLGGGDDAIIVGSPTNLQLQNFTIETWIKRSNATNASQTSSSGLFFGYGFGGYGFGLLNNGNLFLTRIGFDNVTLGTGVTDTNFHHVAVTKQGTNVVFYIDSKAYAVPPYSTAFTFASNIGSVAAIGSRVDGFSDGFWGAIDELAIFNRALSAAEIFNIYQSASIGKCALPVAIIAQPADKDGLIGQTATFTVSAGGTGPLQYQWKLNGTNIPEATNSTLTLTNLQTNQSGSAYSVAIGNALGFTNSSNALLTVVAPVPCSLPPTGLVSWWQGNGTTIDYFGTNDGTAAGNATYGPGETGQSFVFDGINSGVNLGDPPDLRLQDFTIEAWIKRNSPTNVSQTGIYGPIFGYGGNGYSFGIQYDGGLFLANVGQDSIVLNAGIVDIAFHHVAVTKSGTQVVFVVDGRAYSPITYSTTFSFGTAAFIGGEYLGSYFMGSIDEVSVYNRALSVPEIQAIYFSGGNGKCPIAPAVVALSTNQSAFVGTNVSLTVSVTGSKPLTYQWQFNGTNINGATNASLTLTNVQFGQAGNYSVAVTGPGGTTTSSNSVLTVSALPPCAPPPSGIVAWWPGNGATTDFAGSNDGTIAGNLTYDPGFSGQGFVLDGNADALAIGNPTNLQLQDFTIEAWIKRANAANVSQTSGSAVFFSYGLNGYGFGIINNGQLFLSKIGVDNVTLASPAISDSNFHHVSVTKVGTNVVFYIDGVAYTVPPYNTSYSFTTPAALGARGDNLSASFWGTIDELAVYNRSLSAGEIQAVVTAGSVGKCLVTPFLTTQPTNVAVLVGGATSFTAVANGTRPIFTQWQVNGTNLPGETNATLVLTNLQLAQSGNRYSLFASNSTGTTNSSIAVLTVADIAGALDATNLTWTTGGNLPWLPELAISHDGLAAAQSGAIGSNQQSILQTTFVGPGTLTFWWKVSSQTNHDFATFSINGTQVDTISGEVDWQPKTYSLGFGTNTLRWVYSKDTSGSTGQDAAWLDQVDIVSGPSAPTVVTQPAGATVIAGNGASFSVEALGTPPLLYQWTLNSSNIGGATNQILTMPFTQPTNAGSYRVIVSNSFGSTNSASVTLTVVSAKLVAWGLNNFGQTNVPLITEPVVSIAGGQYHSLVAQSDGTVLAWGDNANGQATIPPGLSNVAAVAGGGLHSLALKADGTVTAWGDNSYGQASVPNGLSNVAAISAGGFHSLALRSDGTVSAWGNNSSGQTTVPAGLSNVVAISAGDLHSITLKNDGHVVAWGYNGFGQTDIPAALSNVVAVSAGYYHNLALKNDGTVVAWGYNAYHQTNVPVGLSNVVAIASGYHHNLALENDGTVVAWGDDSLHQTDLPSGLNSVVAIAAGGIHSLALMQGSVFIVRQPWNQNTTAGGTAALNVGAMGAPIINYQWQFNGSNILGATNAFLLLTNIPLTAQGNYSVTVGNPLGSTSSSNAFLTVLRSTPQFDTSPGGIQFTTNGLNLRLLGLSGHGPVIIYASTDLQNWQPISTNPPVLGTLIYLDSNSASFPRRFYRAVEQ